MSKYSRLYDDWPTKADFAHIPHAYPYDFSDLAITELLEGSITARATHLQPSAVTLWGRKYRTLVSPGEYEK